MFGLEQVKNIGSSNPTPDRDAGEPCDPNNWHTIRRTKIAQNKRLSKIWVRLAVNQEVEIWSRNEERHFAGSGRCYAAQGGMHPNSVDRHPQHAVDLP